MYVYTEGPRLTAALLRSKLVLLFPHVCDAAENDGFGAVGCSESIMRATYDSGICAAYAARLAGQLRALVLQQWQIQPSLMLQVDM